MDETPSPKQAMTYSVTYTVTMQLILSFLLFATLNKSFKDEKF
jgi:hypothetical protein